MNGPYLALGKHNYVLRATTEAIARQLGDALIAPIVPFVPEGDIEPPTGHMRYPGSISVTADTFQRLLIDIASSLRAHGFEHVILIGDSGGNQAGMKAVAAELSDEVGQRGRKDAHPLHSRVLRSAGRHRLAGESGHQGEGRGAARRGRD